MAYKLIWSPLSRDDLRDIVRFISRDSPQRAQAFALRLISHADMLQEQPESGRMVPEHRVPHIREINTSQKTKKQKERQPHHMKTIFHTLLAFTLGSALSHAAVYDITSDWSD